MKHELKCWPQFFERVISGSKTFEIRKNDRDFQAGDVVVLAEWSPSLAAFTGRRFMAVIGYVLAGFDGLQPGYVAFSMIGGEQP